MIIVLLVLSFSHTCFTIPLFELSNTASVEDYRVQPHDDYVRSYKGNRWKIDSKEKNELLNQLQEKLINENLLSLKKYFKNYDSKYSDFNSGIFETLVKPKSLLAVKDNQIKTQFARYYRKPRGHSMKSRTSLLKSVQDADNCGPECIYNEQRTLQLKSIFPRLDDKSFLNLVQSTGRKLQNLYNSNLSKDYPDINIWSSLNLSGKREQPLYVEEPHYVIIRKENTAQKIGPDYRDDPFIPPRGRKHMPILDDLLSHYDVFIPHRGKKDVLQDIFKYDETFFPNRGKRQADSRNSEIIIRRCMKTKHRTQCSDNEFQPEFSQKYTCGNTVVRLGNKINPNYFSDSIGNYSKHSPLKNSAKSFEDSMN